MGKKKKDSIQFIITGGTIDSHYSAIKDTAVPNKSSILPEYVENLNLYESIDFVEACMKDSRNLTLGDLKKITGIIERSKHKKIIITHGTYTMADTARYLKTTLKRKDQTVILTGSMIPLLGFAPSDAAFNLGYAVAKVQDFPAGIYICMNGKRFSPDEVMKLLSKGRFVSVFG